MAFDGVPWVVENGAQISGAAGRVLANAASRDAQGVLLPGDLKVSATPTASQAVRLDTGSAVVRNAQAPGESYIGLARSTTDVDIDVTGSPRTDLIVGRIIDPDFSPWQPSDVPDPVNGPYWEPYVIEGVTSGTDEASDVVGYSAIALARVAVPASGNITNGMITDLRKLVQPRNFPDLAAVQDPARDDLTTTDTAYRDWPANVKHTVIVPDWATHALVALMVSYGTDDQACDAFQRIAFGGLTGGSAIIDHNATGSGFGERFQNWIFAEFDVTSLQGEPVDIMPQAVRAFETTNTGALYTETWDQVVFDVRFVERTV